MFIKRFAEAERFEAMNHRNVIGLHLQGLHGGGPTGHLIAYSQYLPGGGAGPDASPFEKVYVVLSGSITIVAGGVETTLGPFDSCAIPADETRELTNQTNNVATILAILLNVPGNQRPDADDANFAERPESKG